MTDYKRLLHEKINKEYDEYLQSLTKLSKEEIIQQAYEKVYKEDIKITLLDKDLDEESIKILYVMPNTLEACYREWLRNDLSSMEYLSDTIDRMIKKERNYS